MFTILTLTISALLEPQATKSTHLALRRTGNVNVILWGGGFGESLIAATQRWFSCAQYHYVMQCSHWMDDCYCIQN